MDRQLLAHGITTELHGVTLSWEGGLRGEAYAQRMFDGLERMRGTLGAQHHVHLRFEAHHLAGLETALDWIDSGKVRFVAINDHLPLMATRTHDARKLAQYADRAECDPATFRQRLEQAAAQAGAVPAGVARLIAAARAAGLQVASHDDGDAATRQGYHQQALHGGGIPAHRRRGPRRPCPAQPHCIRRAQRDPRRQPHRRPGRHRDDRRRAVRRTGLRLLLPGAAASGVPAGAARRACRCRPPGTWSRATPRAPPA
ncbi:hypothetical protein ACU4GD_08200 [Cupriavidus basilensis]